MQENASFDLISVFNLLVSRWKFILGGTLIIMIVAAAGTFLAEETFESSARLMVSSPKFTTGLDVFPREFNEPTVTQMAESGVVYEDLIQIMKAFHGALADARSDEDALSMANAILQSTTQELAERFGWRDSDTRVVAVLSLNPRDVAGLRHLDPGLFKLLDPRNLSEMLEAKAEIEFEGPSEIRWEPIIELKARSGHPQSAAALANIWASITLEHVREVVELGTTDALRQLTEAYQTAESTVMAVQERMKDLSLEKQGTIKQERLDGLLRTLYGQKSSTLGEQTPGFMRRYAEANARAQEVGESIGKLQERLESLERDGEWIGALPSSQEEEPGVKVTDLPKAATEVREVVRSRDALMRAYEALKTFKEKNPIEVLRSRLAVTVEHLDNLRAERNSLAALGKVSESAGEAKEQLRNLDGQIGELGGEIASLNDRIAALEEGLNQRQLEVTRAEEDWQSFRTEYLRLRTQLFTLKEELISRKAEAAAYAEQIAEATAEVEALHREVEEYNSRMSGLEVELAGRKGALDRVSELHAQVAVASRTPFVTLKVISAAPVPKNRVSPNRPLVVLVAGFLGLALLAGYALLRENLNRYRGTRTAA